MAFVPAIFSPFVSAALSEILKILEQRKEKLAALSSNIEMMKSKLERMQTAIIEELKNNRLLSGTQKRWTEEVQHLAEDIEDCIDQFYANNKKPTTEFATKIEMLQKRLDKVDDKPPVLKKDEGTSKSPDPPVAQHQGPMGMYDAAKTLRELLGVGQSPSGGNLKVILVAGFGSEGNSILAKEVYHDRIVRSHFTRQRWIDKAGTCMDPQEQMQIRKKAEEEIQATNRNEYPSGSVQLPSISAVLETGEQQQVQSTNSKEERKLTKDKRPTRSALAWRPFSVGQKMFLRVRYGTANVKKEQDQSQSMNFQGETKHSMGKRNEIVNRNVSSPSDVHHINTSIISVDMDGAKKIVKTVKSQVQAIKTEETQEVRTDKGKAIMYGSGSSRRILIVIDDVQAEDLHSVMSNFSRDDELDVRIIATTAIVPFLSTCSCAPLALPSTAQFFIRELTESGVNDNTLEDRTKAGMKWAIGRKYDDQYGFVDPNCLQYFGMFPCGHPVRRNALLRRWLAEGIVSPELQSHLTRKKKEQDPALRELDSSEQQVCSSFDELTFRTLMESGLIQPIEVSSNGVAKSCQISGLMLDHIQEAQKFITLLCCTTTVRDPKSVRRLSRHAPWENEAGKLWVNLHPDLPRLHTLALFPEKGHADGEADFNVATYKLLRVLDLKEWTRPNKKDFEAICEELRLLKYLSFGGSIPKIPRTITRLKLLETLDLGRNNIVGVYSEVLMLPKLKHLLGKFGLATGLLEFDSDKKKVHEFLQKESLLENLSGFVLDHEKGFAQLIIHMRKLSKVKIWCLPTASTENLGDVKKAIKVFIYDPVDRPRRTLSIDMTNCIEEECTEDSQNKRKDPKDLQKKKKSPEDYSQQFQEFLHGAYIPPLGNPSQTDPKIYYPTVKFSGVLLGRFPDFAVNGIVELCLSWTTLSGTVIEAGLVNMHSNLKYLKLVDNKLEDLNVRSKKLERICLETKTSLKRIKFHNLSLLVSLHLLCQDEHGFADITISGHGNIFKFPGLKEVALRRRADAEKITGLETMHENKIQFIELTDRNAERAQADNY